ncbi:MAG: hypothetical protein CL672_05425 [Balneola sp.]|nr:hypothetical protein [Balneola sp.]
MTSVFWLLCLLLFQVSCASYLLDETQEGIKDAVYDQRYSEAIAGLEESKDKEIYKEKDSILWNLEMGMLKHYNGDYEESNMYFSDAEIAIEQAFTKSISRGISAFLGNDNQLYYDGEPYEEFYLHAFKALNYIHLNKIDASLIEIRKMVYKIDQLNIKLRGLADTYASTDTLASSIDWDTKDTNVQNSPFARYLAANLFTALGNVDAARIERQQFNRAIAEHYHLINFSSQSDTNLTQLNRNVIPEWSFGRNNNILVLSFTGMAPEKIQQDLRVYNEYWETELKVSLPNLNPYRSEIMGVQIWVGDSLMGLSIMLESMHEVAKEVYTSKMPIIYGRAVLRAISKYSGTRWVENMREKEDSFFAHLLEFAGDLYKEGSEKADLRSWSSLPGNVFAHAFQLDPGSYEIEFRYINKQGLPIYSEFRDIQIKQRRLVHLLETHLAF